MRTVLVVMLANCFVASAFAADPGDQALEQLRPLLPSQSHAMMDVEYHFANLWFAARESNWPLATFYLNETRSHVQWTVRLRPVRKLASGQDLDLKPLLDSFERGGVDVLRATLEQKDSKAFESSYRITLQLCYACHLASEKPFLKPGVPREPAARLIQMKPGR
jgi:hypothetical protein